MEGIVPGRITRQERGALYVETETGALLAKLSGKMKHRSAEQQLPTVGDWVAIDPSSSPAVVQQVLPRSSLLTRRALEDRGAEVQLIAANVDQVIILEGLDRPVHPRRMERLLAL